MLRWMLITALVLPASIRAETLIFSEYSYLRHLGSVEEVPVYRVVTDALARVGYDYEVRFAPVKRAIYQADSGGSDGLLFQPYRLKEQYPNLVRVEYQLFSTSIYLYADNKPRAYDICKQRIGMLSGYEQIAIQLSDMFNCDKPIQPFYAKYLHQLNNMMQGGRLDWISAPEALEQYLSAQRQTPLYRLEESDINISIYMYLSARNHHLAKPIAQALEQTYHELGITSDKFPFSNYPERK
ncbi:hypothetical protein R50073_10480 [Maricurvus nonylphenolicus]|uniref:hypothetical protein n=1 Tax=Maricurvus nonylphenolicus TaxID=1008307 RepID=UPI0036F3A6F0